MNKKTTGLVAGAAGAALLLGGATFALWSDSDPVAGGTITAGNLDVKATQPTWRDVSQDRTDAGHVIDLERFRIIPGDTIRGTFGFKAALEGDNMVAELSLADLGASGDLLEALASEATYEVTVDGEVVAGGDLFAAEPVLFASADNSHNVATLPTLPADLPGSPNVALVVDITFPETVTDQDLVRTNAVLDDFAVTLGQVRDSSGQGGY